MSVINTNVNSLRSQFAAVVNQRSMSTAMEQLSSGKRINSSAVDAAGLAVGDKLQSQVKGLNMAVRNINDGISFLQTADAGLEEVMSMLLRARELAVQSGNAAIMSTEQTDAIDAEMDALGTAITNIITNTKWNGIAVYDGAVALTIDQDGTTDDFGAEVADPGLASGDAVADIDGYITAIDTGRGTFGAHINTLSHYADNLANVSTNISASRSRIMDTDYAAASSELARTQIIQQAATAMLAQANQQPQTVLALLK